MASLSKGWNRTVSGATSLGSLVCEIVGDFIDVYKPIELRKDYENRDRRDRAQVTHIAGDMFGVGIATGLLTGSAGWGIFAGFTSYVLTGMRVQLGQRENDYPSEMAGHPLITIPYYCWKR